MIRSINKIANYRAFTDWSPKESLGFSDINVIYGTNGSGKSTLGEMLRGASTRVDITSGGELETIDGGIAKTADDHEVWSRLHVFNRGFVNDNLSFGEDEGSTANHILQLGQEQIEAQKRAKELESKLASAESEGKDLAKKQEDANKSADETLKNIAKLIKEGLGALREYRFYDKGNAKSNIGSVSSASTDEETDKKIVAAIEIEHLAKPLKGAFSTATLMADACTGLAQEVSGMPIEAVRKSGAGLWVEQGLEHHKDRDECLFCASAITAERRAALTGHFDDSVVQLNTKLNKLDADADSLVADAKNMVDSVKQKEQKLSAALRDKWVGAMAVADSELATLEASVVTIKEYIATRRNDPYSTVDLPTDLAVVVLDLAPFVAIIDEHNAAAADVGAQRLAAAKRIEHLRISEVKEEYEKHLAEAEQHGKAIEAKRAEYAKFKDELEVAKQAASNAGLSADELNKGFEALFGRADLRFSVAENDQYQLLRSGDPATHLSEGERNGIALLYFLASLRSKDLTLADAIIVIDDPISSMDVHIASGVSAFLWSRLVEGNIGVKCAQLIVMTHDFEFFAAWVRRLNDRSKKYDDDGNKIWKGNVYELRRGITVDGDLSAPAFYQWSSKDRTQRSRSEYHYLFWRLGTTLLECRKEEPENHADLEAMFLLPNACRRVMESFLLFRYPAQAGNFTDQMKEAAKIDVVDPEAAEILTQFLHANSHNDTATTNANHRRPEAIKTLTSFFEFMRAVDPEHFNAMVKVSKFPDELLRPVKKARAEAAYV